MKLNRKGQTLVEYSRGNISTEDALKIFDELEITTEVAEDDKRITIKFEFNNKTYTIYQIKSKPAETSQTQTSYVNLR